MSCSRNIVLEPNTTQRILIDISFCFSSKYLAKMYSHSSLSLCSIECKSGVIDSDFRGNVNVILHNLSNRQVEFEMGDGIAQVAFLKSKLPQLIEVSKFDNVLQKETIKVFVQLKRKRQRQILQIIIFLNKYQTISSGTRGMFL